MLNVNHSWSFFSTPGRILYVSQQLSMLPISNQSVAKPNGTNSAGSTRSISSVVKAHLNSSYALMMICLSNDVSLNPGPTVLQSANLPTIRGFKISHLNVRSITHKMDSIRLLLKDKTFDIFTVSETWLNPRITDAEITIPGYSVVRKDRTSRGGGVAIFIRDEIPFKIRRDIATNTANYESLLIEINRHKCKKQFVCCIYKPPDYRVLSQSFGRYYRQNTRRCRFRFIGGF